MLGAPLDSHRLQPRPVIAAGPKNPLAELRKAVWRHVIAELPAASIPRRESGLDDLLTIYCGWRLRVPSPRPRTVHFAEALLRNPLMSTYAADVLALRGEIERGGTLLPRMSAAVEHADGNAGPPLLLRRRPERHLDRLLSDWGMHHLHLSSRPGRTPFNRRTRHVLVAAFDGDRALFIDLIDHESNGANWSSLHLLEVLVRSWPDQNVVHRFDGLRLSGGNVSDADRRDLRRGNVNVGAEVDGAVYLGPGITGAGTSARASVHTMHLSWFLSGWDAEERKLDPDLVAAKLTDELERHRSAHGADGPWKAKVYGEWAGSLAGSTFVPIVALVPDP